MVLYIVALHFRAYWTPLYVGLDALYEDLFCKTRHIHFTWFWEKQDFYPRITAANFERWMVWLVRPVANINFGWETSLKIPCKIGNSWLWIYDLFGFARHNGFVSFCMKRQWCRHAGLPAYAGKPVEKTTNGFVWFYTKSIFSRFFAWHNWSVWFCMKRQYGFAWLCTKCLIMQWKRLGIYMLLHQKHNVRRCKQQWAIHAGIDISQITKKTGFVWFAERAFLIWTSQTHKRSAL